MVLGLQQQLGQTVGQGQGEGGGGEGSDGVQGRRQGEGVRLGGCESCSGLGSPGGAPGWSGERLGGTGTPRPSSWLLAVLAVLAPAAPSAPSYQTLLAGGVRGVGPGVGEPLATDLTLEGFFSRVNSLVLFQMMFELEGFAAVAAFKFSKVGAILMI